jgi:alkylation response protein AidB-like acyl-CoA dehydrogenase
MAVSGHLGDATSLVDEPSLRVELVAAARDVLEAEAAPSPAAPEQSASTASWERLSQLGWAGITVPERHGGLGLGFADLCAVLEECGRVLLGVPLADTVVFAGAVERLAPRHAETLLPAIATGGFVGTVALDSSATATRRRGGVRVAGEARFIVHGVDADAVCLFVPGGDEPCVVIIEGDALGQVRRRAVSITDRTRPMAHIAFDVELPMDALIATGSDALRARDLLRARRAITLAAESAGGADRALELATTYALERRQFDRPIGSFQAIKHKLADMLAAVEHARTAARRAAATDDEHDEFHVRAAIAKAYCGDAFVRVAADTIQVHGGIGFTWEHPAHLYYKRAVANAQLVWSSVECREFVRSRLFN